MYCRFCGQELADAARFCTACGCPTTLSGNQTNPCVQKTVKKNQRKKSYLFVVIGIVLVFVCCTVVLCVQPRISLNYTWGTPQSRIENNETVIEEKNNYILCEDPYHKVDKLDELEYSFVKYEFDSSGNLREIHYEYDMYESLSVRERRDVVEKLYGNKYFTIEHNVSDYYATDVWWIGDTVVYVDWSGVSYYDADYAAEFLENDKTYGKDLLAFFNK